MLGAPWLDPLSGIVVAGFVGKMGMSMGAEGIGMLVDARDDECVGKVVQCLDRHSWPRHVDGFGDVRARRMGSKFNVDVWMTVQPHLSAVTATDLMEQARELIRNQVNGVGEVSVQLKLGRPVEAPSVSGLFGKPTTSATW